MTYMRKKYVSLFCTPETNPTLYINYPPLKIQNKVPKQKKVKPKARKNLPKVKTVIASTKYSTFILSLFFFFKLKTKPKVNLENLT